MRSKVFCSAVAGVLIMVTTGFGAAQAQVCSQQRPEKPVVCHCARPDGSKFDKSVPEYSCYNPANGQKCGGPYGQSCYVACDPKNSVPAPQGCH